MGSVRADIRKYETEKKTKFKGTIWPHIRCLYCGMSFVGCPIARKSLKAETSKTQAPSE
jgi:hypothetical protein